MNASAVVLDALAQARWRDVYLWLTNTSAETLAGQMQQLGVPMEKLLAVASAMDSGEPVPPPRSWRAEEKEAFALLPRGVQEAIARRETDRDREVRRVQDEAGKLRHELKKLKETAPPEQQASADNQTGCQ